MFHSSAFAIAAGVVGVAGAATSAGMSMSASSKAAKAQGAAGKKYNKQVAKATKKFNSQQAELRSRIEAIDPTIQIPEYNLQNATAEGIEAANKVTANTLKQLELVAPGSTQARQQVGQIIGSYLRGEVPQDVQEQITRMTAERAGAGFRPQPMGAMGPSGFQASQGQLARNLGLTSLELQQGGVNMASSWQQTAGSFIKDPAQMMALALQGRGQDINIQEANIRNRFAQQEMIGQINLGQFNAMTGQAQSRYGVAQQGIESTLAARQAVASGVGDISGALSGAIGGVGSAYSQLGTAKAGNQATGFGGQRFEGRTSQTGGLYYAPISGSIY